MDRAQVMAWVAEYERGWREDDLSAVERLFTETACYRPSPYEASKVGHDAIKAFWLDNAGQTFTVSAWPRRRRGQPRSRPSRRGLWAAG